jgi:alkanesulfonate monooxygenase SsuD/methylene tetrahydromethanopterin reductase-like flavin-dependent oxidoreductase (luciferase family)
LLADVHEILDGAELAARAQRAEQMGYHSLVLPDYLLGQLSPVATMATVAAATSTLRASTYCPAVGWTSRSVLVGTSPSTTPSA